MRICAKCGSYAVTGSDLCSAHGGDSNDHMEERDALRERVKELESSLAAAENTLEGRFPWPVAPGWTKKEAREAALVVIRAVLGRKPLTFPKKPDNMEERKDGV